MKNKYENLVEEINMQEEIVEKKDNLTEQLSQVTKDVNTVDGIITKLAEIITDLQKITNAVTAASLSIDNAVNSITQAIIDSREVVFTNKLDDETIKQLQDKYAKYSRNEAELFKKHQNNIAQMLIQNKDKFYDIINKADGVYFGRKTFIRLYMVFCTCFGIILLEIAYVLLKLVGG